MTRPGPRVIRRDAIHGCLRGLDVVRLMELAFAAYSRGEAVVPPVGELLFDAPPGDVHIKYGYLRGGSSYVVKIASGFHDNAALGLPTSGGVMLLFSQRTGHLEAVLLDDGYLTDVRTAAAGAVAARYLAPSPVERIGVIGTGLQARLQVEWLARETGCRQVVAWGRDDDSRAQYVHDMEGAGFHVEAARDTHELAERCRLIVTTTAARSPLLLADAVVPGTHVTAMGSDTADKNELDPGLLARADRVVVDSLAQCRERGEVHHALEAGVLDPSEIFELGAVIDGTGRGRATADEITIADLTGVAVQDIMIAQAVAERLGDA